MIREEVQWFAEKMEDKLSLNDYKSGWKTYGKDGKRDWRNVCPIEWLFLKLSEEIGELAEELQNSSPNRKAVILECADVANLAMMIADKFREEQK